MKLSAFCICDEPKSELARDLGGRSTISECARGTSEDVRSEGGEMKNEQVVQLPLNHLTEFPEHSFKVRDDEFMDQLTDSIRSLGVLTPIVVRAEGDAWQIISGHRRVHACEILDMETIPAIVKDIEMDDAIVMMVASNFQRQSLLPSEKARAYKMKLDAVKRQGARRDLSSDHDEQKLRGKTSRDLIAENSLDSSTQIQRFIRLNELLPELLEMVDEGIGTC